MKAQNLPLSAISVPCRNFAIVPSYDGQGKPIFLVVREILDGMCAKPGGAPIYIIYKYIYFIIPDIYYYIHLYIDPLSNLSNKMKPCGAIHV